MWRIAGETAPCSLCVPLSPALEVHACGNLLFSSSYSLLASLAHSGLPSHAPSRHAQQKDKEAEQLRGSLLLSSVFVRVDKQARGFPNGKVL